jgi:hypothetical protein
MTRSTSCTNILGLLSSHSFLCAQDAAMHMTMSSDRCACTIHSVLTAKLVGLLMMSVEP